MGRYILPHQEGWKEEEIIEYKGEIYMSPDSASLGSE